MSSHTGTSDSLATDIMVVYKFILCYITLLHKSQNKT